MTDVERLLEAQTVEGEIGLVIDYQAGQVLAVDVLQAAMRMIESLDKLDAALLSSVDTSLEPVSVLNDVQHSSLKMILARALRRAPDHLIENLEWKQWVGHLLVKGKYQLLQLLEADSPEVASAIHELEADYRDAPDGLIGYQPPTVSEVMDALDDVREARAALPGQRMLIQTDLGDITLPESEIITVPGQLLGPQQTITNRGTEFFKIKSPDMIGSAQWQVIRNGRTTRVDMLHQRWLDDYHARRHALLPGDSLKCSYEESITYDSLGNEIERRISIVEVLAVISPPQQQNLLPPP